MSWRASASAVPRVTVAEEMRAASAREEPTLTLPYNPTLPCALAGIIVGLHGGGARMLEKHAAGFLVARFCLL